MGGGYLPLIFFLENGNTLDNSKYLRLFAYPIAFQVYSGVALIIAPPLGGLVYPLGGVPGVFLLMAAFPVILMFVAPRVNHLVRSAKVQTYTYCSTL